MCFARFSKHKKSGFLLMEAVLALLLLSSFSVVIGMYWQHLFSHQKNAETKLQAVSIATEAIDAVLIGKKNFEKFATQINAKFMITSHKSILRLRIVKGKLENLDCPYLEHVTVTSESNAKMQINLSTISME